MSILSTRRPRSIAVFLKNLAGLVLMAAASFSPLRGYADDAPQTSEDGIKFFEAKIRPLLIEKCGDCHGADTQEGELRLDSPAGFLAGGKSGPVIVPGKANESLLFFAINYKDVSLQMPPDGRLADAEVALLKEWIEKGAPHPKPEGEGSIMPRRGAIDFKEARNYWAFRPIQRPEIPVVEDAAWGRNAIDALLATGLKEKDLVPNPAVDRRTLIRRATYDLTGLPPTPEEVKNFLADTSPDAYEKLIDRLLASKHYGERWGRHWLDVVRYADSNGQDENQGFVDAWRFRNYVIEAFNDDMPFDRFILEQLAGDLIERQPGDYSPLIATAFLALGPKVLAEKDEAKMEMDIIDEQIDVLSQAFLGLTVACARCHDHKFDPIGTADYYALAGILKSTKSMQSFKVVAKYNEHILATPEEIKAHEEATTAKAGKQAEIDALVKAANAELLKAMGAKEGTKAPADAEQKYPEETKTKLAQLREELKPLEAKAKPLPTAMGVQEGTVGDTRIHMRGNHLTLGQEVHRGAPQILLQDKPIDIGEKESGRLQLARWMSSPDNPLTARVAVNRIWRWHFGEGIVPSTDNFGKLGSVPSHPALLDWLASEFIRSGWSIKALHKQIMLSSTYQMSSQNNMANAAIDPDNHLHWRSNVQRLEAEEIRDAMLFTAGVLNPEEGWEVVKSPKWQLVFDHTSTDLTTYDPFKRSIYLPVIRNNLYDGFSLFDYTNSDVTTGSRETSTVAPQALYMMNSDLLLSCSDSLAQRITREVPEDDLQRVARLYEITLNRTPESHEAQRLLTYIKQLEQAIKGDSKIENPLAAAWAAACQAVLASNEFVYVE